MIYPLKYLSLLILSPPTHNFPLFAGSPFFRNDTRLRALRFLDHMLVCIYIFVSVLLPGLLNFFWVRCIEETSKANIINLCYLQERDNMQKSEFLKALSDMWKEFDSRVLRYKVWILSGLPMCYLICLFFYLLEHI